MMTVQKLLEHYLMLIKRAATEGPESDSCNELWQFNHRLGRRGLQVTRQTWREYYGGLIDRAAEEGHREGLSGSDLRRFIRGQTHPGREGIAGAWGLKMWQQEFRFRVRGLPRRKRTSTPAILDLPGQGLLFEV